MKILPVGNNVLIERKEQKEVSNGGIILPGQKHKEKMLGTITGISDSGVSEFKEGDKVIFPDFTGVLVGKNYVIMEEKDIVAKYED